MSYLNRMERLLDEKMRELHVSNEAEFAILNGFKRAQLKQKRRKQLVYSMSSVAVLLVSLTFLIRFSPTFAQALENIPGLGAIVTLVQDDKGIEASIENEYYEEIGSSMTVQDITMAIDGVIADETGMILSYTLEAPFSLNDVYLGEIDLFQNNRKLELGFTMVRSSSDKTITKVEETIRVITPPSHIIDYSNPHFELFVSIDNQEDIQFTFPITLEKEIAKTITYEVNKEVTISDQKLTIQQVKVSPLRAAIEMKIDGDNDMQIFEFATLKLQDEKGELWGTPKASGTSVGYGGVDNTERTYFIESNYFGQPEELYLVIGDIEALPEDERELQIDFEKKQVISQSQQYPIRIENIQKNGFEAWFEPEDDFLGSLFHTGIDRNGQEVSVSGYGSGQGEEGYYHFITLEEVTFVNPVTFKIQSYPNYFGETVKIQVK